MELDVHLLRDGEQPWGFRLIGGVDFGMPLTVVKVLKDSPAEKAGLKNGDTVLRINDIAASEMSHEDSRKAVNVASDILTLGLTRGLYDPVLDDQEPIFEPIDLDDFDQPSRPTEVQDCIDISLLDELPEFLEPSNVNESRSLTESPYLLPTKPYRPFSTEPVTEIPPLEDPIILNPEYSDVFDKLGIDEDFLPKTRFKLPVSEQYDPEGKKIQKVKEEQVTTTVVKTEEMREERVTKAEVEFMEGMKNEIDLVNIELTATSVVNESLEKAMTVAEEIKKEIDVELHELTTHSEINTFKELEQSIKSSVEFMDSVNETETQSINSKKIVRNDVREELIEETTIETVEHNEASEVSVAKEVAKFEQVDKTQQAGEERRVSAKQHLEETIVSGTVKRKTEIFNKELESKVLNVPDEHIKLRDESRIESSNETNQNSVQQKATRTQNVQSSQKSEEIRASTDKKMSTTKLLSEQRAYTIGLQTIPNIRGSVHSSYHYDLLLKTFFIHLTDVMVALSRFILTEPVLSKPQEEQEVKRNDFTQQMHTESASADTNIKAFEKTLNTGEKDIVTEQKNYKQIVNKSQESEPCETSEKKRLQEHHLTSTIQQDTIENFGTKTDEIIETKKTGLKMAQLTDKKSEELTDKMDAVISEFQNKSGIPEMEIKKEAARDTRSRSRSKIEEEVMRENDPLEWLEKVDSMKISKETSEAVSTETSSILESMEIKKTQSKHETTDVKTSHSKEGKQTYIAIVEAHVYTNKDAILEEQTIDFSDTVSVQSADEINIALEANEAEKTENVALENSLLTEEVAKTIIEESNLSAITSSEKVQVIENSVPNTQENIQVLEPVIQEVIEEKHMQISTINDTKTEQIVQHSTLSIQESHNSAMENTEVKQDSNSLTKVKDKITVQYITEPVEYIDNLKSAASDSQIVSMKEESVAAVSIEEKCSINNKEESIFTASQFYDISLEPPKDVSTEFEVTDGKILDIQQIHESTLGVQESSFTATVQSNTASVNTEKYNILESKVTEEQIAEGSQSTAFSVSVQQINEQAEISEIQSKQYQTSESAIQENNIEQQTIQASSFTARSVESTHKASHNLSLRTDLTHENKLESQISLQSDENNNIDTPSPTIVPPTPVTDEYIFKLEIPLPKGITPVPRDPSPESTQDEDPHIVKKNLVAHIETKVEDGIIYDPPLPSPPGSKVTSPVYTKPGLRGGADSREVSKEEILEIERKSSLLASAIDQTIKSIEEYKEEVGIENYKETSTRKKTDLIENTPLIYNGYSKIIETKQDYQNHNMEHEWSKLETQVNSNNTAVMELSQNESVNRADVTTEAHTIPLSDLLVAQVESENEVNASLNLESKEKSKTGETIDSLEGYRPVQFDVEEILNAQRNLRSIYLNSNGHEVTENKEIRPMYKTESGDIMGTNQGIVDGLEEAVVDNEVAKELGKPGMTEEKIAELISGESEMLREAHVMGLARVIKSHMHRTGDDDSSVDFKKIKPIVESLNHSEVLKALNEELIKTHEEKKKEERKWTKFLQKPMRPVPTAKFGYHGFVEQEEVIKEPYKVKIVKQPKPKVAPDYKPKDFETGLLPWEERALREPSPPPVEAEDPILVPEEAPEILEAVDPLPESEVPDLEDSGIPLPPPKPKEKTPELEEDSQGVEEELEPEAVTEETEQLAEDIVEEMDQSNVAEQLMMSVQNMVDPNGSLEQQLAQMRVQLAALAQLPGVIQQSLELVTRQLTQLSQMESTQTVVSSEITTEVNEETQVTQNSTDITQEEVVEDIQQTTSVENVAQEETSLEVKQNLTAEELERMRMEEEEMLEEQKRIEKQRKELMEQARIEHESRQIKQRSTPRVGKPKPVFGPATPQERPLVLPGGRKWRKPQDAYNEQILAETLAAQVEIIQGNTKGINFMKYEKPPVSLDHLQNSDVYKMVHNMEQAPVRRIDMLAPVLAEQDYREKCRSMTPCTERMAQNAHIDFPQQVQP